MASTRFKNVIASQLAKLTGGEATVITKAIDRPKVKGHGAFAVSLPRILSVTSSSAVGKKQKVDSTTDNARAEDRAEPVARNQAQDSKTALLNRIQSEARIRYRNDSFRFDTGGLIKSVQLVGQFLNFTVDEPVYLRETLQEVVRAEQAKQAAMTASSPSSMSGSKWHPQIERFGYGMDPTVGQGKVVAIDYSSPNIAKPFHGGHLRGTILGNFATRLLSGFGYQVVGINYLGDWGKQYGLMAVGFDRYGDRTKLHQDPIKHLYDVYVKINKEIIADPGLDKLANQYFKQMEDNDAKVLSLWQEFRSLSIDFYRRIYRRLGIEFDIYSGESESARFVPEAYELLRKKGLLIEQEDGAWVVDLTKYGLGVCALRRADGTTLYLTRDVAACLDRVRRFKFDRHLYMIGDDQNLHMKRLFKIMELAFADEAQIEAKKSQDPNYQHWSRSLQHISFGKVQGMSTRKGNAIFLEDILDTAQSTMLERMKENQAKFDAVKEAYQQHQESNQGSVEKVADQLGISAVVIQDFQAKSSKGYEFSWKRMTESTGNTGIYLQYAYARLCGIEDKAGTKLNMNANTALLTEPEAFELGNMISQYPDVTLSALQTLEPSTIVSYLFSLSHAISSANQVLQVKSTAESGNIEIAEARLLLLWSARVTLGNGMRVLGLDPLARM
ncbi:Arginyl-tRNA synthetase [Linnemannia zychae]|nr:Arginyl-tRNA synthetase [Linnemannia zychae]